LKRTTTLLTVAVLAVAMLAAGCGGGGDTAKQETAKTGSTAAAKPPPPPTGTGDEGQLPPVEETATAKPFTVSDQTPQSFKDLIELKTPIVVLFYTKADPASADTLSEFGQVERRYANQAEFLKEGMDDVYSIASLPTNKQQAARDAGNLADQLGVKFTPEVTIIDRNSMITYQHSGYIDAKTLEAELFKALKR
jgi:hypothetical protein